MRLQRSTITRTPDRVRWPTTNGCPLILELKTLELGALDVLTLASGEGPRHTFQLGQIAYPVVKFGCDIGKSSRGEHFIVSR